MVKKEAYRNILPHFQQPGQAYFVTWNLRNAIPPKALIRYTSQLEILRTQIQFHEEQKSAKSVIDKNKKQYYATRSKYLKVYNDLTDTCKNTAVDLVKNNNLLILKEALTFWAGKKLENYAFCLMPNHVHWVLQIFEQDDDGEKVYLQDILQSVKRYSANQINKQEKRSGSLWQKESFDTTIRDEKHLYNAIEYTINNPVKAGLVNSWQDWPGTFA